MITSLLFVQLHAPSTITSVHFTDEYAEKMHAMGLVEGAVLTVTQRHGSSGPIIISTATNDTFALSRQLAQHITITPL